MSLAERLARRRLRRILKKTHGDRAAAEAAFKHADIPLGTLASIIPGGGVIVEAKQALEALLEDLDDIEEGHLGPPSLERVTASRSA